MALNSKEKEALTFLAAHLFYGSVAGIVFGTMVLATDMASIWTLARASDHAFTVLALFYFGLLVTFGSVGMAVGVMGLAQDEDRDFD